MPRRRQYNDNNNGNQNQFHSHEDKKEKLGYLSEDVMSYYRNVSASLENGFEDLASKEQFLINVYKTLEDEGIQVSQNQTVSRHLEMLFQHSQPRHLVRLFICLCKELSIVAFDRFASHVFQSLIEHLPAMYSDESLKEDSLKQVLHAAVEKVCGFMENHMIDVMTHTYGSHVLRAFLEALGGVQVKTEVVRSRVSRAQRQGNATTSENPPPKALSKAFSSSFEKLKEKVVKLCNFEDHLNDANYCPLLQTVLLILHKTSPEEYSNLSNTILQKACTVSAPDDVPMDKVSERLPDIVQNEVGSYLVEQLISLASETERQHIYDSVFKGKIIYFAVHPIANFVLQKLTSVVMEPKMMEELLSDVSQYMEDILAVNHIGIVTKIAEACRRTETGQEDFLKALRSAFHCQEPESRQIQFVPLLVSLQTYEVYFPAQESETPSSKALLKSTNIHGSLVLQQLLQFSHPKQVVSSLLDLSAAELSGLCCDKHCSHVIDMLFQSATVSEKFKNAFLKKIKGLYINVACNRNGSRCLENIWKACSVKQKADIAEELSTSQERLEGDQWGCFLYRNFAIFKFVHRRKEWLEIMGAIAKKQQLLQNILQGTAKKKRQKDKPSVAETDEVPSKPKSDSKEEKSGKKRKGDLLSVGEDEQATKKQSKKMQKVSSENVPEESIKKHNKSSKKRKQIEDVNLENELAVDESTEVKEKKKKKKRKQFEEEQITEGGSETVDTADSSPQKKKKKRKLDKSDKIEQNSKVSKTVNETEISAGESNEKHKKKKKKRTPT